MPFFHIFSKAGRALAASVPAMNLDAMPSIWLDMVLAIRPLASPPAAMPSSNPGGAFTPGCER